MDYRKFGSQYLVRLDKGEEVVSSLKKLCETEQIFLGSIGGIGAAKKVEIGLFDPETKQYRSQTLEGVFEITALTGNITRKEEDAYLHLHINFSDAANQVRGGHLVKCVISATAEIFVTAMEGTAGRVLSEEIGLNLLAFAES